MFIITNSYKFSNIFCDLKKTFFSPEGIHFQSENEIKAFKTTKMMEKISTENFFSLSNIL